MCVCVHYQACSDPINDASPPFILRGALLLTTSDPIFYGRGPPELPSPQRAPNTLQATAGLSVWGWHRGTHARNESRPAALRSRPTKPRRLHPDDVRQSRGAGRERGRQPLLHRLMQLRQGQSVIPTNTNHVAGPLLPSFPCRSHREQHCTFTCN